MKISIGLLVLVISLSSFGSEYRVQRVKTLGPMKNKVIFQSTQLKKVKNSNVLKGKLVLQWGLHVYEVVTGLYACNKNNICKLTDFERVTTFEKCEVKRNQVKCRKKISGDTSTSSSTEIIIYENPDDVSDEYDRARRDEDADFPARVDGEFDDIF